MMKALVERLMTYGYLFKSLTPIAPKTLGSRKRIAIYLGVDTKGFYVALFHLTKKSRVLRKEAGEIEALYEALVSHAEAHIPQKIILIDAPLCSKAKALLEEWGWRVLGQVEGSK